MNTQPREIFTGGSSAPTPKRPNLDDTNERILENPNLITAQWEHRAKNSSALVKQFARAFSADLERLKDSNPYQKTPEEYFDLCRNLNQLGYQNQNEREIEGPPNPENPGRRRKYAKRPPPHPMIRRSQVKK